MIGAEEKYSKDEHCVVLYTSCRHLEFRILVFLSTFLFLLYSTMALCLAWLSQK